MKMPAAKNAVECLFSRPSPAKTPNQSQRVGESALIIRTSRYTHPIQNSGSNAFIEKKLPTAKLNSAQSEPAQASAIAHGRPPSSRAIKPVIATVAAPASAGRSEEHTSELQSRPHLVCR